MVETRPTPMSVLLIGAAFFLTGLLSACGGTPAAPAPASSRSAGSTTRSAAPTTTPADRSIPTMTSAAAPLSSTAAPPPPVTEPDCTQQVIQDAVNTDRGPDARLTVSPPDFHCQDDWAVAGGTDTVNKAQYSFVLRWADGQWQTVPDRSQACAGGEIPADLVALACNSN